MDETVADAQRRLAALGLVIGTITTEKNPGGIPGTVLSISPDIGSSVPQGSAVDLVLIERADFLAVPNVVGLTWPDAEALLQQAGLRVGSFSVVRTDDASPGRVMITSPRVGGPAAPNSGVDLVFAALPLLTIMPDLGERIKFTSGIFGARATHAITFLLERMRTGDPIRVRLVDQGNVHHDHILEQSPGPGSSQDNDPDAGSPLAPLGNINLIVGNHPLGEQLHIATRLENLGFSVERIGDNEFHCRRR